MELLGRRSLLKGLGTSSVAAAAAVDSMGLRITGSDSAISHTENAVLAGAFGVKADGRSDDTVALQSAIDHILSESGPSTLLLPAGKIHLTKPVIVGDFRNSRPDGQQIIISGSGAGENGTWLSFSSGSLVIAAPNHVIRDIRVSSRNGNGIVIRSEKAGTDFPSRGMMENVRAEFCSLSGITIEDCWVYSLINCFARFNRHAGLEGKAGSITGIACNALTIVGGEFQGNGTKINSKRGIGAGIVTGRCVQFSMTGGAIEGNLGDGVILSEQLRGFSFSSVYFEKNGTHADNCDITTEHFTGKPSDAVHGPNSGWLLNCNFTPQDEGGHAQDRAIDLMNVKDLRIVNPQFFAQSKPVHYAQEPIRLRETQAGRCTGWVEGGYFSSVTYTQKMVRNEAARYGFPRTHRFSPNLQLSGSSDDSPVFCIPLPDDAATRVDITTLSRPVSGVKNIRLTCAARFGPVSRNWSERTEKVHYQNNTVPVKVLRRVGRKASSAAPNFVEVRINVSNEAESNSVHLMSVEIVSYEAQVM